ncbi:MAG TPA: chorismate synthase [Phycisphaerales bacterium]|nr:chorismate synthase [Phycisphaerales bacterium]
MAHLDYVTAGESHGPGLLVTVSGMPSDLPVDLDFVNAQLARRQGGFGRSGRMGIEEDRVEVVAGVRRGATTGAPVAFLIRNKDARLDDDAKTPAVHRPRPGHADFAGSVKWLTTDCRDTLERASARETAARVAAGALARLLLRAFAVETVGFVRSIGTVATSATPREEDLAAFIAARDASETYCPDADATQRQIALIREAKLAKDTVGGLVETHVFGCPPGLGTCADWRDRLDARLAYAVMGVQAIKSVEIGLGKECASLPGSRVHDPIRFDPSRRDTHPSLGFSRDTNNAGGLEGGMTNGQPVVVRAAMKPISTLLQGMPSVDLNTKQAEKSQYERSDICAVPAASVVVDHVVAFEVARALREKFGGDSMTEVRAQHAAFMKYARMLPLEAPITSIA